MIVRISGEGQWTLADDVLARLNELDNAAVAAVEAGDEPGFHAKFDALLAMVRADGERLPADDLHPSDVILPPRRRVVRRGRPAVHRRRPDPGLTRRWDPRHD